MDPVSNMQEQVEIATRIHNGYDTDYGSDANPELEHDAARLAELVLALDEWRKRGGFDPYGIQPPLDK